MPKFNPPSFVQPQNYDWLPRSIDDLFAAYGKGKRERAQRELQEAQIQAQQQQMANAQQLAPVQLQNQEQQLKNAQHEGARQRAKSAIEFEGLDPEQVSSGVAQAYNPDRGAAPQDSFIDPRIQRIIDRFKTSQQAGVQKEQAQTDVLVSQAQENRAQASAAAKGRAGATADGKMLPAPTVLALNEGASVARLLPDVEDAIKQYESSMGPISGRIAGANPYSTKAQTVDARLRTASQAFGRFMEKGVLRKEDEEKYRKMFPQLSDTSQVAKNKLAIVRRQLAQEYESQRSALGSSGYDVSGFGALNIPPSLFGEQPEIAQPGAPIQAGIGGDPLGLFK